MNPQYQDSKMDRRISFWHKNLQDYGMTKRLRHASTGYRGRHVLLTPIKKLFCNRFYAILYRYSYMLRIYAILDPGAKLVVHHPRMRNELRYYKPKASQKQANCVSPNAVNL